LGDARKIRDMIYDKKATSDDKGRLYYFDNAKFILIFLVVLAHALGSLNPGSPFCLMLWYAINYFHMPAMIFISGFFAKRYISKPRRDKVQRVATYAILYLAAQISLAAFERFVLKVNAAPSLLEPRGAMWFLQCLAVWYLMLPVLDCFQPKVVMAVTVVAGLLIGYEPGAAHFMSISRAFVHLPFFMAGYYIKQAHIEKLQARKFKIIAPAVFAAVAAVSLAWPKTAINAVITCKTPYAKIPALAGLPWTLQWSARLWFYVVAAALIFGFLALVPRGKAVFTGLGKETLSVYILHAFLLQAYLRFKWHLPFTSPGGIAAMCLISLAVTVVFSMKPFTLPFHWLQKIKVRTKEYGTYA